MDPRQPQQHPFSRNTASSYGRTPFPPSSNQPYPASSHPPPSATSYAEHQRRPSDPPFYGQQRSYAPEGPPMAGQGHARHQSASSVGVGPQVNRSMPPPSSPQQQAPQQPPHHNYGPPPPRAPPVSVGPPSGFPTSRDLPALPSIARPQSNGSSMSISSMLGGPPPALREPAPSQYASSAVSAAAPASMFGQTQPSPRVPTTAAEYAAYRRPQTPEHPRNYEPRDNRANSAGSPPVMGHYSTPEGRRFGTPQQGYGQRVPIAEERREPIRVPNANAIPPRPSSQPNTFNPPPQRVVDPRPPPRNDALFGRRVDTAPRAAEPVVRQEFPPPGYGRPQHDYGFAEVERQEREALMQREREREALARIEREQRERAEHENNLQYAHQLAQRNAQNAYNRPPEPRDQNPAWMRPGYEQDRRYEQPLPERPPPQQASNGYEYPTTTAPQYGAPSAYAPPNDHRYSQAPQAQPIPLPQQHNPPTSLYERENMERQRLAQQQEEQRLRQAQQQQQQQAQAMYSNHQNQQYHSHESPQRRPQVDPAESQQMQHQRSFLGVQEINRKGRASPLPQAVQGAQGQINGPSGEPSIKNEFGRMFSGIGNGIGAMSVPSPVSASQGMPFSNSGQLRRDDLESLQDSPIENGNKLARSGSRQGGGRRRKLKEEDKGDDESSTGRRTPSGNGRGGAKRAKTHHHAPHHHHHHRPEPAEINSSPSQLTLTPFKNAKGSAIPSPPGPEPRATPNLHHHHVPRHHHHHHHATPSKPPPPVIVKIPFQKPTVKNQAVLDSVAHYPRHHLGQDYYTVKLKPEGSTKRHSTTNRGFATTPQPLPHFEGKENSTFTVIVPRIHLSESSREEITSRKAVWGTDIYTDDSDIIAACIHQGWFRGSWPASVDVSLLDLEIDAGSNGAVKKSFDINDTMTCPPPTGPIVVPANRDCHVTILVLPTLEKYSSTTRFGLRSREWGFKREGYQSVHDGLSFMIQSIKWVKGVDGQEGRNKSKKKIFDRDLDEMELEEDMSWDRMYLNGKGDSRWNDGTQESFERGARPGDIRATKNWISGTNGESEKGKEREGEPQLPTHTLTPVRIMAPLPPPIPSPLSSPILAPEPSPVMEPEPLEIASPPMLRDHAREVQQITDRMIQNANTATPVTATLEARMAPTSGTGLISQSRIINETPHEEVHPALSPTTAKVASIFG